MANMKGKGKLTPKQEEVLKIINTVTDPTHGELLRRWSGLKNSLRGRVNYEVVNDVGKFLLDLVTQDRLAKLVANHEELKPDASEGSEPDADDRADEDEEELTEAKEKKAVSGIGSDRPTGKEDTTATKSPVPSNSESTSGSEQEWQEKSEKVCRFWKRGKCIKKNLCPGICGQFMHFGLAKFRRDGKGCNTKCNLTHPPVCRDYKMNGSCSRENCKYKHVKTKNLIPPKQQRDAFRKVLPQNQQYEVFSNALPQGRQNKDHVAASNTWAKMAAPHSPPDGPSMNLVGLQSSPQSQHFLDPGHLQLKLLIRQILRQEVAAMSTGSNTNPGNPL